jgi:hypothetical protein
MLHGVRFIQSQLHARVAEFSLREWLAALKQPQFSQSGVTSHARKSHRDAKIHCFLSGVTVAVEGELPARALVLVPSEPVELALLALSSLTPIWSPTEQARHTPGVQPYLLAEPPAQTAAYVLAEELLVVLPTRTFSRAYTESLMRTAGDLQIPVVVATVQEGNQPPSADALEGLLARRDVLVTVSAALSKDEAQAYLNAECAPGGEMMSRPSDWQPANVALNHALS